MVEQIVIPIAVSLTDDVVLVIVAVLGGLTRALYGLLKNTRNEPASLWYFIQTLITSGVIGGVAGTMFNTSLMATAMIGYIGSDILDNIMSAISPKKIELRKGK